MAAISADMMTFAPSLVNHSDGQAQAVESPAGSYPTSTPSVSTVNSDDSIKTICGPQIFPTTTSANASTRSAVSASGRSHPLSILVCADPDDRVLPAASVDSHETSTESESSPVSSENESQDPGLDDSSRTTLSSCSISSGFADDSTVSSIRTRATTLSSTSASPSVTFAPLPKIAPRKRNSSRPLGLAARGQILRQRRMMAQDNTSYYDDRDRELNSIPGGERLDRRVKDCKDKARQSEIDETEVAIAALGKMLGDATKILWQRVAHPKSKSSDDTSSDSKPSTKRPKPARGFTWPGRLRSKSSSLSLQQLDSDDSDSEDGPWSRHRDEDPMTKTIVEGSDEGHGLEQFVLAYDAIPACAEEEEDFANARADEEMRTTVEVHLVKVTEGETDD